jgi:tetratricopeptide (TPR) repeat protein
MIRKAVLVLFLGVAQIALAQAPAPQGAGGVPAGLVQKQAFARSLVEDAAVAERIKASQDAEALRLFALAKENYASALASVKGGDYAKAEQQFNDAMSAMGKARRLAPDAAALAAKQRAEYAEKLQSVEGLEKSYRSYLKHTGRKPGAAGSETDESATLGISRLLEAARRHAAENRPGDALRALDKAEQVMRSALNRVLGSTTLDYALKFETPAEEFAFELERNRSYVELVPVAIAEYKPKEESRLIIEVLVKQSREAIEQARSYAEQKDYQRALASVRSGTEYLMNALGIAGLVVPQ